MTERRPATPVRWFAVGTGVLIVGLIGILAFGSDDRLDPASRVLGQRVPEIAGPTLDGGHYDVDDARGRWVVVNFFATWCPGCVNEHPELVEFDRWARRTGEAEVVAVVFNDPPERVAAFFDEHGGDWPLLDDSTIPLEFQVSQIPETFVVAPSGLVVQHIAGEVDADTLIALIEDNS
ncbi:MAG: TlpA family protein disulfide reductase [Acidimicrobiales bacterium]